MAKTHILSFNQQATSPTRYLLIKAPNHCDKSFSCLLYNISYGLLCQRLGVPLRWLITCLLHRRLQDIHERFHLLVALCFVLVEDMDSAASWTPAVYLLVECVRIMGWEAVIDVIKHAVLGKFNDIRPGIYRQVVWAANLLFVDYLMVLTCCLVMLDYL